MIPNVAIVVAAKNEANNIADVVEMASKFGKVIVVNDGSTDETGEKAFAAGAHVLTHSHSTHIKGSFRDGFRFALRRGFNHIVQMDAGRSHSPTYIPDLLAALEDGADMVIGSRFVPGGKALGQTLGHEILSRGGGALIRMATGMKFADSTSGFRAYKAWVLSSPGLLGGLQARAHAFQFELVYRVCQLGYDVREVPITYVAGRSSVQLRVVFEALTTLCRLAWERIYYGGKGWMYR